MNPSELSVLLLNPPLGDKERSGALAAATGRSMPYGLLSLAAVIRSAGYPVQFLDASGANLDVQETCDAVLAASPKVLGITTVTQSIDRTAEIARRIKEKAPSLKIVIGGPHVSSVPAETFQRFDVFDVGVLGEGEHTIVELLDAIRNKRDLQEVVGLVMKREGTVIRTGRRPLIEDLDSLPMPAWDLVPSLAKFYRPSAPSYLRLPSTTIITSRGCFGKCIFCNSKAIHGGLRCFSAGYVLDMVRHLQDAYKIRDFSIYDDNFVSNQERLVQFCETILREKRNLTWSCYSRVDQGEPELFKLMKRAGCWQVSYGIESGAQRILDFIQKGVTLEQIEKTIRSTHRAGLRTRGFFMIGHFNETESSIRETIDFLLKLPLDDFHFTAFTPLPGTKAYRLADQYGTFDRTWDKMNLQTTLFVPNGLNASVLESYSKMAYRRFYFRPRILRSYLWTLMRHPKNMARLVNGGRALLTRVLSGNN